MDYQELAVELLLKMQAAQKIRHQKGIKDNLRGEDLMLHYILAHCQDAVIPKEISDATGVSPARVAAVLNDLENKGLITREINRNDRRKIIVRLTGKGQSVADDNKQEVLRKTAVLLNLLGEHDAKEYVRIMGRLSEEILKINL